MSSTDHKFAVETAAAQLPLPTTASTGGTRVAAAAAAAAVASASTAAASTAAAAAPQPAVTTSASSEAAPRKRPLMTHGPDGKLLSEKKLRRLEKNRLSARECRRRKREATEQLLHQINQLEGENLQLRLQLQIGKEAETAATHDQNKFLTEDIHQLLQSGASEADIYATLEEFKEKYAEYGQSRRSAMEFHLRQIERLLMPTQTTSVVMHAIQGGMPPSSSSSAESPVNDDGKEPASAAPPPAQQACVSPTSSTAASSTASAASVDESTILPPPSMVVGPSSSAEQSSNQSSSSSSLADPKGLFQYLVRYLEITPEQATAMKDSRWVAQEMDGCLEKAMGVLEELRQRLAQTGEDLESEFNNVRAILTPTQAAKFLVWVANNAACMHMLEELWDRVYPSPATAETDTGETSSGDNNDTN